MNPSLRAAITSARTLLLVLAALFALGTGVAYACAPQTTARLEPGVGEAGSTIQVRGAGFKSDAGPVNVHWNGRGGTLLGTAQPTESGGFTMSVTVPASAQPGHHWIQVWQEAGRVATREFQVTAPRATEPEAPQPTPGESPDQGAPVGQPEQVSSEQPQPRQSIGEQPRQSIGAEAQQPQAPSAVQDQPPQQSVQPPAPAPQARERALDEGSAPGQEAAPSPDSPAASPSGTSESTGEQEASAPEGTDLTPEMRALLARAGTESSNSSGTTSTLQPEARQHLALTEGDNSPDTAASQQPELAEEPSRSLVDRLYGNVREPYGWLLPVFLLGIGLALAGGMALLYELRQRRPVRRRATFWKQSDEE